MSKKKAQEKRLATLAEKREKSKKELVKHLRRTPIPQVACERAGVGRSTYYQWRAKDLIFARAADRAIDFGKFFINDMAESRLIRLIQEDNLTAIIFWLKHNHPKYAVLNRVIHEFELVTENTSVEEKNVFDKEMARIAAGNIVDKLPALKSEALRKRAEEDLKNEKVREKTRKQMEAYEEEVE